MKYLGLSYNPERDIQKVVPDLSIDLIGAIDTGIVLDTGTIAEHNDIDSPGCILGRVRDVFDAFEAQKRLLAASRASQSSSAPSVSNVTDTVNNGVNPSKG